MSTYKNSYEKICFLFLGLIFLWQIISMFYENKPYPELGPPIVSDSADVLSIKSEFALNEYNSYMNHEGDFLVPSGLKNIRYVFKRSKPPAIVTKIIPPRDSDQVFLPEKPVVKKTPKKVPNFNKKPFVLPVVVKGFITTPGKPQMVLVTKKNSSEYLKLGKGDSFGDITVVDITSESVVFADKYGRELNIRF